MRVKDESLSYNVCMVCSILITSPRPPRPSLARSHKAWKDSTGWGPHMKPCKNRLSKPSHASQDRESVRSGLRKYTFHASRRCPETRSTYFSSCRYLMAWISFRMKRQYSKRVVKTASRMSVVITLPHTARVPSEIWTLCGLALAALTSSAWSCKHVFSAVAHPGAQTSAYCLHKDAHHLVVPSAHALWHPRTPCGAQRCFLQSEAPRQPGSTHLSPRTAAQASGSWVPRLLLYGHLQQRSERGCVWQGPHPACLSFLLQIVLEQFVLDQDSNGSNVPGTLRPPGNDKFTVGQKVGSQALEI